MSLTVHLALVFHVFITVAVMVMVCGRRCLWLSWYRPRYGQRRRCYYGRTPPLLRRRRGTSPAAAGTTGCCIDNLVMLKVKAEMPNKAHNKIPGFEYGASPATGDQITQCYLPPDTSERAPP